MEGARKYPGKLVFGLDIGTRSVVGTVGYRTGEQFYVVAQRIREHETRAMLDGQIHDIGRVGLTIAQVKTELEAAIGEKLRDVCIAAAGRVLRTVNVHTEQEFEEEREVTQEDIFALDSKGIEAAYAQFNADNDTDVKFYCVGYSVMRYYMNNYVIGNLEDHKTRLIGVDLIATFLPEDVVDGLYKAVGQADLEVVNLTLEPIAAIQVAIPEMYRMLNIALVDVGAGTSDISITQGGSIIAYGMIPVAGDALTEAVAQRCLVDFATAEQIKRECSARELIEYKDIMGLTQTISREELLEVVKPVVDSMTEQVARQIRALNGDKSVSAVFIVGGGGKIPSYAGMLAEKLELPRERVALRGEEVMQKIQFLEKETKKDSLLVTPIGICLSFYEQSNSFVFVTFNNRRVKLYDNSRLAVVDAAMQADFPNESLFPRRGRALHFKVDGKSRMIRGQLGEAAVITVNGTGADIYTPIHANDIIVVQESTAGSPAALEINKLPEFGTMLTVEVNEKRIELPKFANVNGKLESGYYDIQENDEIEMASFYTVRQIAEFMDVIINEKMHIYVNNKLADMDTKVYENFSVIWTMDTLGLSDVDLYADEDAKAAALMAAQEEILKKAANPHSFSELLDGERDYEAYKKQSVQNGEEARAIRITSENADLSSEEREEPIVDISLDQELVEEMKKNGQLAEVGAAAQMAADSGEPQPKTLPDKRITVTVNGKIIVLSGKPSYVFVDVFDQIDFDLSMPQGKEIVTRRNGKDAQYMENLEAGDQIQIYWRD